jgi:hypothetical protein
MHSGELGWPGGWAFLTTSWAAVVSIRAGESKRQSAAREAMSAERIARQRSSAGGCPPDGLAPRTSLADFAN